MKSFRFWSCVLSMFALLSILATSPHHAVASPEPHVVVIPMDMMILPGTLTHLDQSLRRAAEEGAKAAIVRIDTPGGLLQSAQEMVQVILSSPIPVFVYVGPSGATATSAGVFITLAGHVAAMAPGTTIGAATPVSGDGTNIESDMKAKAENMTTAMVRAISEQRGRNLEWGEKAVKEAASITETEALKLGVIDLIAANEDELLRSVSGRTVTVGQQKVVLEDWSNLPRRVSEFSTKDYVINVLANPNVVALLWLGATTGISIEFYNPGLIFPGVMGVICLILALAVSQIIPINQAAVILLIFGAGLVGAELYTGTLILGVLGVVSMVMGALYLINEAQAPGLAVAVEVVLPMALLLGGFMLAVAVTGFRVLRKRVSTGVEGLVGMVGEALGPVGETGRISVNGENWSATSREGVIESHTSVEVVAMLPGLVLEVKKKN